MTICHLFIQLQAQWNVKAEPEIKCRHDNTMRKTAFWAQPTKCANVTFRAEYVGENQLE